MFFFGIVVVTRDEQSKCPAARAGKRARVDPIVAVLFIWYGRMRRPGVIDGSGGRTVWPQWGPVHHMYKVACTKKYSRRLPRAPRPRRSYRQNAK
jgi:hypothetical protein